MRERMPRSDESAMSPLHASHFKEPQFQRVMPVSRAVWLRFTDTERQTVGSSKGQLPTVTSQAVEKDSSGARMCVTAVFHRGFQFRPSIASTQTNLHDQSMFPMRLRSSPALLYTRARPAASDCT